MQMPSGVFFLVPLLLFAFSEWPCVQGFLEGKVFHKAPCLSKQQETLPTITATSLKMSAEEDEEKLSREEQKRREEEQTKRSNALIQEYYRTVPKLVTIESLSNRDIPWRRNVKVIKKKLPDPKPLTPEERQAIKAAQKDAYQKEKYALLGDTVFLCLLGFGFCWSSFPLSTALSYGLGSLFGILYLTLLARFVENLGEGGIDSSGGSSRIALVILLVLLGGKYKTVIQIPPALVGFFTYQVTTLLRGILPNESSENEDF